MGKPVVHFEIGCRDKAKTAEFYSVLFDWTIQETGPAAMIATVSRYRHPGTHLVTGP